MKTIQEIKDLLKGCLWNATPYKKLKGWGMHGSSICDAKTEEEAWNLWYEYCKNHGVVK